MAPATAAATAVAPSPATLAARARSAALSLLEVLVLIGLFLAAANEAYRIRLYAIEKYGRLIHEFDPWFNMRATEYLAVHGAAKFFKWYDYASWYPLGRPVGTTIYPGMQFTSVAIWEVLKSPLWAKYLGLTHMRMKLNDVCVFVPAWFGAVATVTLGLLAREVSGSWRTAAASALVMSVIPSHLMRSIGGGYDNESVAMTAMCLTFFLWCRSLRTPSSWPIGVLAGLAYGYMVAAWGGYIFVGNMVALHAGVLVALGYYSPSLHAAYSLWYAIGTAIAIQVPVVGMAPLRSLEQMAMLLVFLGLHFIRATDALAAHYRVDTSSTAKVLRWRLRCALLVGVPAVAGLAAVASTGYFGPLSVRVRSLFVKHTRTGNPLVDSVAEHQPASSEAYWHHLHYAMYLAPVGFAMLVGLGVRAPGGRVYAGVPVTKWFIILYAAVAYYFANRMSRLLILLGPVCSVLAGEALAEGTSWALRQMGLLASLLPGAEASPAPSGKTAEVVAPAGGPPASATKGGRSAPAAASAAAAAAASGGLLGPISAAFAAVEARANAAYESSPVRLVRLVGAGALLWLFATAGRKFWSVSDDFAHAISQPSLVFKGRMPDGKEVTVTDYLDSYKWLKKNTPQDARVLAWWDYGYQINGIANRTSIADGNTWNLEHIAMLGRILTSPEKRAHSLARHLADYVLIWAGHHGDDLGKSPHMARISSSVYSDVCGPQDPLCHQFGFYSEGNPTPMMANSLLYKLHSNGLKPGVSVDPTLFEEAYRSQYGLVRIYKILNVSEESKAWIADPSNRVCDAPGSWYCVGKYPPALEPPPSSHLHIDYETNRYSDKEDKRVAGGGIGGGKNAAGAKMPKAKKSKPSKTPAAEAEL